MSDDGVGLVRSLVSEQRVLMRSLIPALDASRRNSFFAAHPDLLKARDALSDSLLLLLGGGTELFLCREGDKRFFLRRRYVHSGCLSFHMKPFRARLGSVVDVVPDAVAVAFLSEAAKHGLRDAAERFLKVYAAVREASLRSPFQFSESFDVPSSLFCYDVGDPDATVGRGQLWVRDGSVEIRLGLSSGRSWVCRGIDISMDDAFVLAQLPGLRGVVSSCLSALSSYCVAGEGVVSSLRSLLARELLLVRVEQRVSA